MTQFYAQLINASIDKSCQIPVLELRLSQTTYKSDTQEFVLLYTTHLTLITMAEMRAPFHFWDSIIDTFVLWQ